MAKEKATITLDRAKAEAARTALGAPSTSAAIDIPLDRVLHAERLRQDVAAYTTSGPDAAEEAIALVADVSGLADDTDWAQTTSS
jgi:hypothetical protein